MAYGVTPQGFNRARVPELLAEIEETARGIWGQGIIQTAQTELGQLNGLVADLCGTLWEIAEATYQSYDPDQAEGVRLEQLGRMRLLERIAGEGDAAFREAITNTDRARLDMADIERAAASAPGVTWCKAYATGRCSLISGMPARAIAVAVLGGDDGAVAAAIRPYIVPGIDTYGNVRIDLVVDGYCRPFALVRPIFVPLKLNLAVRFSADRMGCPPPSAIAVAEVIGNAFSGASRPVNGQSVTLHLLRTILAAQYPNVEIVSGSAALSPDGTFSPLPYTIGFTQMAQIDADDVTVAVV